MENRPAKITVLVKTIISLHEQGYSEDFFINEKRELIWGQKGYPIHDFTLDPHELSLRSNKELNTLLYRITLHSGTKGILLCQNGQMDISNIKK